MMNVFPVVFCVFASKLPMDGAEISSFIAFYVNFLWSAKCQEPSRRILFGTCM